MNEKIHEARVIAQAKIARALQQFETVTGLEVERVVLDDVEVTRVSDTERQFIRQVVVEFRRRPGVDWATYPHLDIPPEGQ